MTQVRKQAFAALAGVLALGLAGCGSSQYVPVSGTVTLNGQPYRHATVEFDPISTKDNPTPGRGSIGHTDDNGHFSLKAVDGHHGAAVGRHHVRIKTPYSIKLKGYEVWDSAQNKFVKADHDPIPPEWNYHTKQQFEVPPGGTDAANFNIVTAITPKS
jgi:hypothetical protein